jgi:hypothetical protein
MALMIRSCRRMKVIITKEPKQHVRNGKRG